ncbi:TolC family protein [Asticcacaulis sp. DXS10W]|uniref:TolC family protein n=1 Tax=Asticcacaulis currens TaxID=2984210 RepID=A0ABT5IDF9_9CAUL|nr:TolC family protein [Asticcacaulis currens]MDC7694184.1 TolC family protein [Asticcacaulis currens]
MRAVVFLFSLSAATPVFAAEPPAASPACIDQQPAAVATYQTLWSEFADPGLICLAQHVLNDNPNLKAIRARVEAGSSIIKAQRARRQLSVDGLITGYSGNDQIGSNTDASLGRAGLEARWEIDVRQRLSLEEARAGYARDRDAALYESSAFSLLADLTQRLIALRALDGKIDLQIQIVNLRLRQVQRETARLQSGLVRGGRSQDLEANLAAEQNALEGLQAQRQATLVQIEALTGYSRDQLNDALRPKALPPVPAPAAVAALPLDRLAFNPKVRAAASEVAREETNHQIALAARWPRVSLSGFLGLQDGSNGLRLSANPIQSLSAQLLSPIFDRGRIDADVATAASYKKSAIASYHAALTEALEDSQLAVAEYEGAYKQGLASEKALAMSVRALQIDQSRQRAGLVSDDIVTEGELKRLSRQMAIIQEQEQAHVAFVRLQRVLGPQSALSTSSAYNYAKVQGLKQ